ncbi:MAG: HEAT repeat domain-containing protein, partial [Planctomycetota bacterium]
MAYRKHLVPAVVMGVIFTTCCFAKGSTESYSELLRKAVEKASMGRGGFSVLSFRWRGDERWGEKQVPFRPFVEGLAEPNAVPFLVKVIYQGWRWDKELPTYALSSRGHAGRCYSVLSLAVSGDPVAFAVLSDILENDANFTDPCLPEIIKEKYGIRTFVTDPCLGERDKRRHDIRIYAAAGLGILGDSNAVEPLLRMLGDKSKLVKFHCMWALGRIGDVGAVKPMLEAALHD